VLIAAPIAAPEFAQVLGLQMSVLARDGIQRAELQLNPAEMGPVSVQIVMDGTQARVDFGADLAATRQAIEAGLPELASALRDAGFTLAGGGVSQHSGGRSHADEAGDGGSSGRRHRPEASLLDDAVSRVSAAARRVVSAGGIDLFV
jgi:flagellar hook-length control protein FliK